jgi:hypothetical protein
MSNHPASSSSECQDGYLRTSRLPLHTDDIAEVKVLRFSKRGAIPCSRSRVRIRAAPASWASIGNYPGSRVRQASMAGSLNALILLMQRPIIGGCTCIGKSRALAELTKDPDE